MCGLLALIGIALALRAYHLGYFSLWLDETTTYAVAAHSYGGILEAREKDHLVLQYVIAHAGIRLHLDAHEWLLRLPFMLCGVATIPALWLLGNVFFERATAWVAAVFAGFWPALILSSQEYRLYSLFILLSVLSVLFLFLALRTQRTRWWVALTLALLLNLNNHFLALLQVAALGLYIVGWIAVDAWQAWRRGECLAGVRRCVRFTGAATSGVGAILTLGAIPTSLMLGEYTQSSNWNRTTALSATLSATLPDIVQHVFGASIGVGRDLRSVVPTGLALIGIVWACRFCPRIACFALPWYGLPLVLLLTSSIGRFFLAAERYLSFILVIHLIFIARGVVLLGEFVGRSIGRVRRGVAPHTRDERAQWIGVCVVALLVIALIVPSFPAIYRDNPKPLAVDLRGAYQWVTAQMRPDDFLLESNLSPMYSVHWFSRYDAYYLRAAVRPQNVRTVAITADGSPSVNETIADARGRVWVIVTLDTAQVEPLTREAADHGFATRCSLHICALRFEDTGDPSARSGIVAYLRTIAPLAPETSRALLADLHP